MALGIVVDDTIHILSRHQHNRYAGMSARESVLEVFTACGRPVIFTGITNFMGFIILSLSSFAPLVSLGWLTAVTMITALSGDLVLQPALLVLFDKKGYRFHSRLTPDPDAPREPAAASAAVAAPEPVAAPGTAPHLAPPEPKPVSSPAVEQAREE
jgi:uncharacterized membrane protein YdfJ with MMPL/SSD domain